MKETGNWVHNINSCNASWHLYQQVKTNYQEQFLKIFSLAELEVKFGCGQCVHQFSFWVVLNTIQIWKPHLILITTVTQWDGAKRNNLRSLVVWLWPVWCHQFGVASVAPSTICIINQDFHSTHQVSWWIWRTVNWRQVQWDISGVSQWVCMQLITLQSSQWQISLVHLSCCCQCPLLIRPPVQCNVQ